MRAPRTAGWIGSMAVAGITALAGVCPAAAGAAGAPDPSAGQQARYELVHGCFGLRSQALGRQVAGPLRLQATDLGRYLLYTTDRRFLAAGDDGAVSPAGEPSPAADWRVDVDGDAFTLTLPDAGGRALVAREDGLAAVQRSAAGAAGRFVFEAAEGCPRYPEVDVNVDGAPAKGATPYAQVSGFLDGHLHHMAYEFLGGKVHCGAPWHRYGAPYALPDCGEEPYAGTVTKVADPVLGGTPGGDPVGWPTFRYWPNHEALTYEQTYWRWMERAWRGGLRLFVNLFVDNEALCNVYPVKQNPCNDMNSVRLQHRRIHQLQDYIDAQAGGPGKGFYRIVKSPFEARRVINEGKLAVVLGIEVSRLFECGVFNDVPQCDRAQVDRQLEEVWDLGVRGMELVNKFDNAFSGVAGDSGVIGPLVNGANFTTTGSFWKMQTCTSADGHAHDREQMTPAGHNSDSLFGAFADLLPGGALPLYPAAPHCNARGLTELGEHLVRRMMEKGMMIDPDHMSVVGRHQLLNLVEAERYPGMISSHSWSDPAAMPRIYGLGGVVTPYAGSSESFVRAWRETKPGRSDRFHFGFGYGADMNGFGSQGGPRGADAENPVTYPFKAIDGQTIDRQRSGERVFDINTDGVAHYGLYPDWVEDLRKLAGQEIVDDMAAGAEAYLQTWERAFGIAPEQCRGDRATFLRRGLGQVRLGDDAPAVLRRAGQPAEREGRVFRYCVQRRGKARRGRVSAVFDEAGRVGLVVSTAPGHRSKGLGAGARGSRVRGDVGRAFGSSLRVRAAGGGARYVYGLRKGRVRFVAVASRTVARTPATLRAALREAGL